MVWTLGLTVDVIVIQMDQDFLDNMEDFVTLDELAEDEDEADRESDSIGTRTELIIIIIIIY